MKARIKRIPKRKPATSEDARRFASNVSIGLVTAGAIIALVLVANKWAAREELTSVRIVGRSVLDSAEVMRSAGLAPGVILERLDLDSVERNVAAHPFIASASAYRAEGGVLVLEIAERTPVAVVLIDGVPSYLDSTAALLPYRFSPAGFDLPLVRGVERGGPATTQGVETLIDTVLAREALTVVAAVRAHDDGLYRQISEVCRDAAGEYTLVLADGAAPVRCGRAEELPARLRKLDRFMTGIAAERSPAAIAAIDLRWKGQVVVRWRNAES